MDYEINYLCFNYSSKTFSSHLLAVGNFSGQVPVSEWARTDFTAAGTRHVKHCAEGAGLHACWGIWKLRLVGKYVTTRCGLLVCLRRRDCISRFGLCLGFPSSIWVSCWLELQPNSTPACSLDTLACLRPRTSTLTVRSFCCCGRPIRC